MILVDSSVWIEFDNATGSSAHRRLADLISSGADVAVSEPVLMEVLAGARSDARAEELRRMLTGVGWVPMDPVSDFEGAAKIYRSCRAVGITPRSLVDCLLATIAVRTGCAVLAHDRDFDAIATVVPLQLDRG